MLPAGTKTGLSVRPAFGKALKQVYGDDRKGFVELHDMMMRTMEDVGREYGIERNVKHDDGRHVDVTSYTARREAAKRETEVASREARATELAHRAHRRLDDVEAREQAVKAREEETADVEARATRARAAADKAEAEAKQAREDAETTRKATESARRAKRKAETELAAAEAAREKAEEVRRDVEDELEDLRDIIHDPGPDGAGIHWQDGSCEPSLRRVRDKIADAKAERDEISRDLEQYRNDYEVAFGGGRKPLRLVDVVRTVVRTVAGILDHAGAKNAAQWLRDRVDGISDRVVDTLVLETRRSHAHVRQLADDSSVRQPNSGPSGPSGPDL